MAILLSTWASPLVSSKILQVRHLLCQSSPGAKLAGEVGGFMAGDGMDIVRKKLWKATLENSARVSMEVGKWIITIAPI